MSSECINAADCGASGSEFTSRGKSMAGSNQIILENTGDFMPGQWITADGCFLNSYGMIYNDQKPCLAVNQKILDDEIEIDMEKFSNNRNHQVFIIYFTEDNVFSWMAVDSKYQTSFREETDTLTRQPYWCWQGKEITVSDKWIELLENVKIRFNRKSWKAGEAVSFHVRNRLYARIISVNGNTLTLDRKANVTCSDVLTKHNDQTALQTALDLAIKENKPLFIPAGRFRLNDGLWIKNASVRIEGAGSEKTLLDISEAHTACFWIAGGKQVTVRNLAMLGHCGQHDLPATKAFKTKNGHNFWPTANQQMEVYGCAAVNAVSTESMLFEDIKVTRMASEAFYLHGSDRAKGYFFIQREHEGIPGLQDQYQKQCIFNRIRVFDCGFNAFNNNDFAENTSILNCHVEHVGNFCENASRFIKIIGNYVHDCAASSIVAVREPKEFAGLGQAIISNNVFEGGNYLSGVLFSGSQSVISNNVFCGFSKETALEIYRARKMGGSHISCIGNVFDMTRDTGNPEFVRDAIAIDADNVIVADNHILDRKAAPNPKLTGIAISANSKNIHVHDNIIENCSHGIRYGERKYNAENDSWIYERNEESCKNKNIRIHDNSVLNCANALDFPDNNIPIDIYRNYTV